MGLTGFKILFENPVKTYHSGEIIKGRLVVVLDSPKKYRAIKLKLKGVAHTSWTTTEERRNAEGRTTSHTITLTGDEEYFGTVMQLAGGSGELEMPPGEHVFDFQYALPPNLPSSFESDLGHVRYTVKGVIDRPWRFDHETKEAFTIVSKYDLNSDPRASEPVIVKKSKTFGCLCCASPPLSAHFSLPVRGYVPGQSIPIKVNIKNESDIEVYDVVIKLTKEVTYRVNRPKSETKTRSLTIAEVNKGHIQGNERISYEQTLKIPALPPSNLDNCGIIDVQYLLKLEACVDGCCRFNLKASTEILIGTIPLIDYQSQVVPANQDIGYPTKDPSYGWNVVAPGSGGFQPSAPPLSEPSAPPDYSTINQPGENSHFNLPPPSYEESVFGAWSVRDEDESRYMMGVSEPFAPRYPVYNFPTPQ